MYCDYSLPVSSLMQRRNNKKDNSCIPLTTYSQTLVIRIMAASNN